MERIKFYCGETLNVTYNPLKKEVVLKRSPWKWLYLNLQSLVKRSHEYLPRKFVFTNCSYPTDFEFTQYEDDWYLIFDRCCKGP